MQDTASETATCWQGLGVTAHSKTCFTMATPAVLDQLANSHPQVQGTHCTLQYCTHCTVYTAVLYTMYTAVLYTLYSVHCCTVPTVHYRTVHVIHCIVHTVHTVR